jgi:NADP-dependent 3-hydroxy acid dehydrogenase YdfG
MTSLGDQVAIITGASSGIGEATAPAPALAAQGATVVIAARRADRLALLRRKIVSTGGTALDVACDVAVRDSVRNLIDATMQRFGRIDILINNAAIMANAPMSKCRIDDWDDMIDINIRGLLYGIGYALPVMLKQKTGHIVNISSIAGRKVMNGGIVYCATKHAVHVISEGLRSELAESAPQDGNRIRVTVIAPGVVMTELPESIRDEHHREISRKYYNSVQGPLLSGDIAEAILYAVTAPPHVGVNEVLVRPVSQAR